MIAEVMLLCSLAMTTDDVRIAVLDRHAKVDFDGLTPAEQIVYLVVSFQFEIECGGLLTYFTNSAGDQTHELLAAMDEIGAMKARRELGRVIKLFPRGKVPADRDEREPLAWRIGEEHADTVEAVYDSFSGDAMQDLYVRLDEWVQANISKFDSLGKPRKRK